MKWFFISLIMSLMFCSSGGSSSQEAAKSPADEFEKRWILQKASDIPIPADGGGQPEITRNFYFIMDGSGSMRERTTRNCGGDQKFSNKMEGARWAIKKFLEYVPDEVNIGLYVFDRDGQREAVPLGSGNRETFLNAVDKIDGGGGTPLAQSIRVGTDRLVYQYKKQLGYGEFRLVVITDGEAKGIPSAALYAAKYGIPIYSIGLCVGQYHPLRRFSVSYRAADNFADLSQGLQDTLAELPDFDVTQFENSPGSEELK
ncbi:MAG: VWA domain-containing protein [bacterium]|nr:VWA domain-containing protein [bacterium]